MTENLAPIHIWSAGSLPDGVDDVLTRLRSLPEVEHIAVMPDVHLAAEFCVGTVVASQPLLFPNAVGGDIGCGMLALRFDASADILRDPGRAARLLGAIEQLCPGRRHHRKTAPHLPTHLRHPPLSHPSLNHQKLSPDTLIQLGTLGAGNHFLEFQSDPHDQLWLMLHTGSRHLGQLVHHHHLPKSRKLPGNIFALDADSPEGRAYFNDIQFARAWARENRRLLALAAARALEQTTRATPLLETLVDCDHNHLSQETHFEKSLFIHRKGATAAHADQSGLIPGSMGTASYHTRGLGNANALCSSSHGAGRALSRTAARQSITRSALRHQLRGLWYDARLERTLIEEAPAAYKPIEQVMHAQSQLTTPTRTLKPLLVYKAT